MEKLPDQPTPDDGSAVVFLHGIGGNADNFEAQITALRPHTRALGWNFPGYQNTRPLKNLTFETLANALHRFLDEHNIISAHLVGHSIGGMLALEMAARYPERVKSLALIATTSAFGGRDDTFKRAFLKSRLAPLDAGQSVADLAGAFIEEIVGKNCPEDARKRARQSMASIPETVYRQVLACLVTFDRRDLLPHLSVPTLLVAGDQDTNAPARTMQRMGDSIQGSRFVAFSDTGHLIPLEQPDRLSRELIQFYFPDQTRMS